MSEPLGSVSVIAPVVVLTAEALEKNQAASVGKFWLLRVPSAKVSSKMVVALRLATLPASRAKQRRIILEQYIMMAGIT